MDEVKTFLYKYAGKTKEEDTEEEKNKKGWGRTIGNTLGSLAALSQGNAVDTAYDIYNYKLLLPILFESETNPILSKISPERKESLIKNILNPITTSFDKLTHLRKKSDLAAYIGPYYYDNIYTKNLKNFNPKDPEYIKRTMHDVHTTLHNAGYKPLNGTFEYFDSSQSPEKSSRDDRFKIYKNKDTNNSIAFLKDINHTEIPKDNAMCSTIPDDFYPSDYVLKNNKYPKNPKYQKANVILFGTNSGSSFDAPTFGHELGHAIWNNKIKNNKFIQNNTILKSFFDSTYRNKGEENIPYFELVEKRDKKYSNIAANTLAATTPLASMLGISDSTRDKIDLGIALGGSLLSAKKVIPELMASYYGAKYMPKDMKFKEKIKTFDGVPTYTEHVLRPLIAYGLKKGFESGGRLVDRWIN